MKISLVAKESFKEVLYKYNSGLEWVAEGVEGVETCFYPAADTPKFRGIIVRWDQTGPSITGWIGLTPLIPAPAGFEGSLKHWCMTMLPIKGNPYLSSK